MAKNDITGDEIISKIFSDVGRKNYDKIFMKKTAREWIKENDDVIPIDFAGWNLNDEVTLDTPINEAEYLRRLNYCKLELKLANAK